MVRVISAEEIKDLDKSAVKSALAKAFAGLITGASVQPVQTLTEFPGGAGDVVFYPGALVELGVVGVKVSPYLSALAKAGKPPVTAYTLLLSVETGEPILLCDSLRLTTIRTAATTALAVDYLAPASARRLAIFGAGNVAQEHLAFALHQRSWGSVSVFARSLSSNVDGAEARRAGLIAKFGPIDFPDTSDGAAEGADVIMLCTSSGTPVLSSDSVLSATVVTSISTNARNAHEIDPRLLASVDVYCDYRATAPTTAGDFVLAAEQHGWDPSSIVGDLAELAGGVVTPPESGRTRFFRSTGLGIEDLTVATLL
ncbi:MAG: ornithine cyclodeaminase family protein [Microbacterium sp.]|jgi:L-arginine dehydrogenase|uniref:ornithine cyclodeaminase family protein n=1 Tax=Microbacterium sp. TaxID=51671 RepID=UPI0025E7F733|nr:ornithine cyclodeaminase family protein [Microbacterium sp.]MBQ9917190.1 ornithine cyclodeaminase family protein [Microbacterium sp.]